MSAQQIPCPECGHARNMKLVATSIGCVVHPFRVEQKVFLAQPDTDDIKETNVCPTCGTANLDFRDGAYICYEGQHTFTAPAVKTYI